MMKKLLVIFPAFVLALSCGKQADPVSPAHSGEIVFTSEGVDVDMTTKAGEVTSLDAFNVNCVTGTPGLTESSVFVVEFSKEGSNYTGGKFWPSTDTGYKFYASNASIVSTASGATIDATNQTDIVCAVCVNPQYRESNTLTFNHIFARLGKTTVTVQEGYTLENFSLTITPRTGGRYNLYAGNGKSDGSGWTATTEGSALTLADKSGVNSATDTYLVPGSYTLTATYTLKKGDYSFTNSNVSKSLDIAGGKISEIKVSLAGGNAVDVFISVSVTPWGSATEKAISFA